MAHAGAEELDLCPRSVPFGDGETPDVSVQGFTGKWAGRNCSITSFLFLLCLLYKIQAWAVLISFVSVKDMSWIAALRIN